MSIAKTQPILRYALEVLIRHHFVSPTVYFSYRLVGLRRNFPIELSKMLEIVNEKKSAINKEGYKIDELIKNVISN